MLNLALPLLLAFQQPVPIVLAQAAPASNHVNDRGPAFYMVRTPGGKREDAYGAAALRRRLSLNLHDVSIADALSAITAQTGIRFVYMREEVPVDRHVSLSAQDIALAAALTEVLFDAGVDVELLSGNQVALVQRRPPPSDTHQRRRVTGRVLDAETKAPLPGAVVTVTGTAVGAITSDSGTFAINLPDNATSLSVRRIGYRQTSVTLTTDQNDITVELTKDPLKLETQVVTGVATSISSRNAANAVAVVNSDQINEVPAPTLENALQSKIPGATIEQNNGGAPGGGLQIQIRGITSIEADASPLYVVDGVLVNNETTNSGANAISQAGLGSPNVGSVQQFEQDNSPNRLADINPNDIESIEVLKGSSASAIYGAKAASGVVIITTKKGSPGRTQWNVTQRFGTFTLANKLPLRTFPTLKSAQDWYWNDDPAAQAGSRADADAYIQSIYGGPQDYQSQLFGGGELSYETDLSVRGATENGKTTYFLSGLTKYDNGILLNTGYNKQSVRTNVSQTLLPNLTLSGSLFYANSLTRRGVSGNDNVGISPYDVLSYTPQFINLNNRSATGAWARNVFGPANPFADAEEISTPENVHRFIGGGTISWTMFKTNTQSLQISTIGGADYSDERAQLYAPPDLQQEQSLPSGLPGVATSLEANTEYLNYSVNLIHHYVGSSIVDATTSIGLADERRNFYNPNTVGQNLVPGQNSFTAGSVQTGYYAQTALRDFSFYGQEQLLLLSQRLALTGGLTAERSSNDGSASKYYSYPKVSASYRIPHLFGFLDEIKGRVAYGQSGTEPTYGVKFSGLTLQVLGATSGAYTPAILGDPQVRPETNTEIEGGIDATMFGSRAQITATVYQKRISNVLLQESVNPSYGATTQWLNGGQFTNRGLELSLAATPIEMHHGLTWISTTTFYRNYSVVDNLAVPAFDLPSSGGGPFGIFLIQPGRSVSEVVSTNPADVKKDGVPVQIGDAQPAFQMGFTNDFTLGGFHLHGVLDWKVGSTADNANNLYFDNPLFLLDSAAAVKRLAERAAGGSPYVEDAGYVKLREITLAYDLPSQIVHNVTRGYVYSARLSLSGRNLWASFKYTGPDPEVSGNGNVNINRGNDVTQYPPARSWFVSLDLGF
ncbi:MAG TPA: SusC/RagA family TonB-linked outer membrane protein [Gemmatimonadaceae bacterium]|nr:SusC/RagA family TonB-linked outer membrane protein [Gemmatimonadaceae bacterium]